MNIFQIFCTYDNLSGVSIENLEECNTIIWRHNNLQCDSIKEVISNSSADTHLLSIGHNWYDLDLLSQDSSNERFGFIGYAIDIAESCGFSGFVLNFTNFDTVNETNFCHFLLELNNVLEYRGIEYESQLNLTFSIVFHDDPCQVRDVCEWKRLSRLEYVFFGGRNYLKGNQMNETSHLASIQKLEALTECFKSLPDFDTYKLVLTLTSFGLGYKLSDLEETGIGVSIQNEPPIRYSYSQICNLLESNETVEILDQNASSVAFVHSGIWVTYENPLTVSLKTAWGFDNGFSGVLIDSSAEDDPFGDCGTQFPLTKAALEIVNNFTSQSTTPPSLNEQIPIDDVEILTSTEPMIVSSTTLSSKSEQIGARLRYGSSNNLSNDTNVQKMWFKVYNYSHPLEYEGGVAGFTEKPTTTPSTLSFDDDAPVQKRATDSSDVKDKTLEDDFDFLGLSSLLN